jgi:hypothetical protein
VTLAAQAVLGFFTRHQDLAALLISGLAFILLLTTAIVMHRKSVKAAGGRPLPETRSNPVSATPEPLLRGRWGLGWRIETAVLGNEGDGRKIVTEKLCSLVNKGKAEIPANHHELCDGQDPAPGMPKFLTVTLTNTIRQEDVWKVPHYLLETNQSGVAIPPKVIGDFNNLTWPQKLALARISRYGSVGRYSLGATLAEKGLGKPIEETIIVPLLNTTLIEEDGQHMLEIKSGREDIIKYLLAREDLSSLCG